MKIEAGKFYKTRDGRKVGPMRSFGSFYCWATDDGKRWTTKGHFIDGEVRPEDLIAEWTDEQPYPIHHRSPSQSLVKEEFVPEAPEMIWADTDNLTWVETDPAERMKDCEVQYVRADLATPAPQWQPKVKPLVWTDPAPPNDEYRYDHVFAESALGRYSIEWKSWKEYDDFGVFCAGDYVCSEHQLEYAKAAAQADYERRILAALQPPENQP